MTGTSDSPRSIHPPDPIDAMARVLEAQRLFARTLATWTGDLLVLRRSRCRDAVWHPAGESLRRAAA